MSAGDSIEAFRAEARAWLEANCPPEMRDRLGRTPAEFF
jgi:hypothetical protein